MKARIIWMGKGPFDAKKIAPAARAIRNGGLAAFPTETVYGLGSNALDGRAIKKIFLAKGRPSDNPLIVHVAEKKDVKMLVKGIPEKARLLMEKFWPGPLTIVLRKSKKVPDEITAGLNTVAIRMPDNRIALELIRQSGVPIAAPSANLSGKPSPTSTRHVIDDMDGRADYIIDGGDCRIGVESTVLDMTGKTPMLLRPGGISLQKLRKAIGKVEVYRPGKAKNAELRSPGMRYRHYAPNAELITVVGKPSDVRKRIAKLLKEYGKGTRKVCVMTNSKGQKYGKFMVRFLGSTDKEVSRNLFRELRDLDRSKVDVIISELLIGEKGLGLAVRNRLRRASRVMIKV